MAFLNLRKNKKDEKPEPKKLAVRDSGNAAPFNGPVKFETLKKPRVTEKASSLGGKGIYVFDVSKDANKNEIISAVKSLYNVTPIKVRVAPIPYKKITVKGRPGISGGGKKAYVYLKKGEKIEVV